MQDNRGPIELNQHLTDTEIMWAIRYLDPDLRAETTGDDAGTRLGVSMASLIALAGVLTYMALYFHAL